MLTMIRMVFFAEDVEAYLFVHEAWGAERDTNNPRFDMAPADDPARFEMVAVAGVSPAGARCLGLAKIVRAGGAARCEPVEWVCEGLSGRMFDLIPDADMVAALGEATRRSLRAAVDAVLNAPDVTTRTLH